MHAQLQTRNDSIASQPQTATVATQEQRFVDNRRTAVAQRELAEIMNNGPQVLQQRALSGSIDDSLRQATQRQNKTHSSGLPTKASSEIVQRTVWEWNSRFWRAVRTEGLPTAQPGGNGAFHGQRISTGPEADLYADANPAPAAAAVVQPPQGYALVTDSVGQQAYLADPNGHRPAGVALDHLVDVAHGNANRVHRSQQMQGNSQPTYVHPNDDELYTFSTQAAHNDGIPKITIHEIGKVRGGVHKFQ